jgi:hypothetical protein
VYHITVLQHGSLRHETSVTIDDVERNEKHIHLVDDRHVHAVVVTMPIAPANSDVGR